MTIKISTCIIGILVGFFAIVSSLSNIIMPIAAIKQALCLCLILTAAYNIVRRNIMKKNIPFWVLAFVMVCFLIVNTGWTRTETLLYTGMILVCLSSDHNMDWVDLALKVMEAGYFFYAAATIFLYFNRNIYLNYVVKLFPDTASRLVKWYNSGYMAGLTNHYSTNAMLVSTGLLIFATRFLSLLEDHSKQARKQKIRYLVISVLYLICILLTAKRAHIIFTTAALLGVYVFTTQRRKAANRITGFLCVLIGILIAINIIISVVPTLSGFIARFQDTMESGDITMGRYILWGYALDSFSNHFLFGIGWKNFAPLISTAYKTGKEYDVHNIYLQLMAETGIIGFTVYLSWFVAFLHKTLRLYKNAVVKKISSAKWYLAFSLAFQIFFLLYGMTGNPLYKDEMFIPYFMSCAITLYFGSHTERTEIKKAAGNA